MTMAPQDSLVFKVWRCEAELIRPAKPMSCKYKRLLDVNDQDGLQSQVPGIQYRGDGTGRAIQEGLAKTLVFYYPFAGRLREWPGWKLVVDCKEKGVVFMEADTDITVDDFGDTYQPPFTCLEELLSNILDSYCHPEFTSVAHLGTYPGHAFPYNG